MKNTIIALTLLLFIVIGTCVYQKTSIIYDQRTHSVQHTTKTEPLKTAVETPQPKAKPIASVITEIPTQSDTHPKAVPANAIKIVKPVAQTLPPLSATKTPEVKNSSKEVPAKAEITLETKPKQEAPQNTPSQTPVAEVKESEVVITIEEPVQKVKKVPSAPIKQPLIVATETKFVEEKVSIAEKPKMINSMVTDKQDIKTIDNLIKTLEEETLVSHKRDKIEERIEALIKKALKKRSDIRIKIELLIQEALENKEIVVEGIKQEEAQLLLLQEALRNTRAELIKKIIAQQQKHTGE